MMVEVSQTLHLASENLVRPAEHQRYHIPQPISYLYIVIYIWYIVINIV